MSTSITRRGTALLVVVGAMLLAALAAPPHADAATFYACVKKKSGTARIFTKKPKCKRGERKLSWNSAGPAGRNGTNGSNGSKGSNGTNGSNGINGQDLISQTPLRSGQSESGAFGVGDAGSKEGFVGEGISFSQPLAAPIAANHVVYNPVKTTSPTCPGFGQAAPGFVCLYESEVSGLTFDVARDFALNENAADKYGFALFFTVKAAGFAAGSWTVTAP